MHMNTHGQWLKLTNTFVFLSAMVPKAKFLNEARVFSQYGKDICMGKVWKAVAKELPWKSN